MSIIGGSGSGKNLIKHQRPDIKKIHLRVKNSFESNYQFLIIGREKVGVGILKIPKAFNNYSQTIDDVYENLEDFNPTNKKRVLIFFKSYCLSPNLFKSYFLSPQCFTWFYITLLFQRA